jgi:hypothetical protein
LRREKFSDCLMISLLRKVNLQPPLLNSIDSLLSMTSTTMEYYKKVRWQISSWNSSRTKMLSHWTISLMLSIEFGKNMILTEVDLWTEEKPWNSWMTTLWPKESLTVAFQNSTNSSKKLISTMMDMLISQKWPDLLSCTYNLTKLRT